MRTITLNDDDMREPCEHNDQVTCGHCNRSWCGTCTPTPSARCPFEYEHEYDEPTDTDFPYRDDADDEIKWLKLDPELQWGEESAKFQESLDAEAAQRAAIYPIAPHGGCNWSGCTTCFPPKDEVTPDPGVALSRSDLESVAAITNHSPREIWDIHNEGFIDDDNPQANGPCPVCSEANGFHNEGTHRRVWIDTKYLLEKGWHQK